MDSEFLKYGDQICLYSEEACGYLTTIGFNSPKLYIQHCSKLHRSHIVNVSNFVFEIVPKLSYDCMKEWRRDKKAQKLKSVSKIKETTQEKAALDEKFKMLEKRIKLQHVGNEDWIYKMFGKKVLYGSQIQLRHKDSGMYLQHAKKASQIDRRCQEIELVHEPSAQRVTFSLNQRYNYRQEGEPVVYNDHIVLFNIKYNCYLHISLDQMQDQVKVPGAPSKYRPLSPQRRVNPDILYKRLEVNCSSNFFKWQVVTYRQFTRYQRKNFIFSGDLVRLKHAETAGYLCHDDVSKDVPGEPIYVRVYKGQDESDKFTTNNLFEIELHSDFKQETVQNAGAIMEWQQRGPKHYIKVRFRHVNSGKLLTLSTIDRQTQRKQNQKATKGSKKMILNLGDNLTAEQVNWKLDNCQKLEDDNKMNFNFNFLTDPKVMKITKGVNKNQQFEIENTVVDHIMSMKRNSVVKIYNRFLNPTTGLIQHLTVSTEVKKHEGDAPAGEGEEEPDMSMFDNPDISAQNISGLQNSSKLEASRIQEEISIYKHVEDKKNDEQHETDETKYTQMSYDESDHIQTLFTKLIIDGTMDDVFIVEKADDDETKSVLFIHSCIPKIKEFTHNLRFNKEVLTSPYIKTFEDMLSGLIFFVIESDSKDPFTCEGQPVIKHQKFLREIKIIDLLVDIIIYPFESPGDDLKPLYELEELTQRSPMTKVCQLIYRLLKHCVKDNDFNKFYVAQWISHFFFQSMMTTDENNLQAEDTIEEILRNNRQLLDKQINMSVIKNIVDNLASAQKNERFLSLLCQLCCCNDEAVGSNQDNCCELFLNTNGEHLQYEGLLIKVETVGKKHNVVFEEPDLQDSVEIVNMKQYFEDKRDDRLYKYFQTMVNLVSLMCQERNYPGIDNCVDRYPIDFLLDSFLNSSISYPMRSNLARALDAVHIDKKPLEMINLPILTRVWDDIKTQKSGIEQQLDKISPKLKKLNAFVLDFFSSMGGIQRCYKVELNNFTLEVLKILDHMIMLGFYGSEQEIVNILNPVIQLLDGSMDFTSEQEEAEYELWVKNNEDNKHKPNFQPEPFKRQKEQRYKRSSANDQIFAIKKKIIQLLVKILDFQDDIRLTKFLIEFFKSDEQIMKNPTVAGPELFFLQNMLQNNIGEDEQEQKDKIDEKVIGWMRIAFGNKNMDMKHKSDRDIICILLDIILYQDSVLVNSGFTLLAKYFSQKRSIIYYAGQVQILQDEQEVAIFLKTKAEIKSLMDMAEQGENWMGIVETNQLTQARVFIRRIEKLTELCIFNPDRKVETDDKKKNDDDDDAGEEGGVDKQEFGEYLNLTELKQLWDNEDPKICDDDQKNDLKNQILLKNLIAYQAPILIIKMAALEEAEDQNAYLRVLEKCYIFLLKFVRNNSQNQKVLLEYIDLFIDDMEYGVHAWELIAEIFKNSEMLYTYNLVPILKKAIKLIDSLPKETQKKTILLSFLNYFIDINGVPRRENQNLIQCEITSSSRKNMEHLFTGDQGLNDLHLYLLEMKNSYQEFMADERFLPEIQIPPELSYTIEYIRLLGHNGEGKNSLTEGIASDKVPLDDLIENLRMADFCYPLKSSLVYFMDTIYFDIEKEVTDENIAKMNMVIEIIYEDLEKFIRIEQRVQKAKDGKPKIGVEVIDADDLEKVDVDINKNFNLMTAFGSFPIVILMEQYIFEVVFPAMQNFFDLRLSIKPAQKKFFNQLFVIIQKVVSFAKKDIHFEKSDGLFKTIKKIPQLKEFGGEVLNNKLLTQWIQKKNELNNPKKKKEVDLMVGLPQLTQAEKLKAYLMSVEISDSLMQEFEREFEEIVVYIIGIKNKTEVAFDGSNTLDVKELINSLIKISGIESDIDPNLRIICLKVMRKVVELENLSGEAAPALDWDDEWEKYADEIEKKQTMLIELDVIELVCDLIALESKRNIKEESLLVAVALLLGGNEDSQSKFHEYIVTDKLNQFVQSLQEMLMEAFEFLRETQTKRNEQKLKLIGIKKKIVELEALTSPTKQSKLELRKLKDQERVTEDDIKLTDQDDQENPAAYVTNDLTVNRSIRNCIAILKFLQLLCENHNHALQEILRVQINDDQKPKLNSFDFISTLAKQLESFLQVFNDQTFDVCNGILDTLVESIQGPCKDNQKAMVQNKIIDTAREIISSYEKESELLHLGFETEDDIDSIGEFKGNVIQLLTSLLEGETDYEIIDTMTLSLDFSTMKNRMCMIFARFASKILGTEDVVIKDVPVHKIDSMLEGDSFQEIIQEAFQLYILLHTLADSTKLASQQLQKKHFNFDQWKVSEFIRSHTGRIEILMDGALNRIYFPISPICQLISRGTRKKLMTDVNRESQQSKVRDLLYAVPNLIDEMHHNDMLNRATLKITPERLMALKDFSSIVGLIMNLTFLCFATRKFHYKILEVPDWAIDTIEYLGYVQGSSSLILIFFFAINKKPLITNIMWRDMILEHKEADCYQLMPNEDRFDVNEMSYEMTHLILMLKGPEANEFNLEEDQVNFGNWFTYTEFHMLNTYFFIQDGTFQYYVLYFAISLLGKYSQDIYYSFHLLDVINRSVVLQNVMLAISMNIVQVMMTIMLMMIFVYIYTVMTFFYLQDGMYDYDINGYDSDIVGENNCLSMFQCLVTQLDKGLRNGGGVGDITEPVHFNDEREKYLFKLVHDATFQIIVNIICLNIIFGIVVNSFAELRDQKSKNDFDTHNRCYICNLEYLIFERAVEGGFARHIEKDHNLWQYVFYIVHLNSKNSSDYDGVETFVSDKVQDDIIDWVPNAMAMCLQQGQSGGDADEEGDSTTRQLEEFRQRIQFCAKSMDEISKKLTKKAKEEEEERKQAEVDANNRSSSMIIGQVPVIE